MDEGWFGNAMNNLTASQNSTEGSVWNAPWPELVGKLSLDVLLVLLSGLFSGLTLGLLGLDTTSLEIVAHAGSEVESQCARQILPMRRRGNLLLCTLLMGNTVVNSLLSIILAGMTSGVWGLLLSTAVITMFGEILPMAACTKHALRIGAWCLPLVTLFMVLLYPLTKPIALLLDFTLGKDVSDLYDRNELRSLLRLHADATHSELSRHEERLLSSVLEFPNISVLDIMTGLGDVFMLNADQAVTEETKTLLWRKGHSRIPVYENDPHNIIGMLFVKDLVVVEPSDGLTVRSILHQYPRQLVQVFEDTKLPDVLKSFKTGRGHMAIVQRVQTEFSGDPFYETIGVVTLEDVIERLIQDEIVDETDVYVHIERRDHATAFNRRHVLPINEFQQHPERPLQEEHVAAIASFLMLSCPAFNPLAISLPALEALVREAELRHVQPDSNPQGRQGSPEARRPRLGSTPTARHGPLSASSDPMDCLPMHLYTHGVRSETFTLVLAGRVAVTSGVDGYRTHYGLWTQLGLRALQDGPFVPDFTAWPVRPSLVLCVSRALYRRHANPTAAPPRPLRRRAESTPSPFTIDEDTSPYPTTPLLPPSSGQEMTPLRKAAH